jgi:hypothetical protein
MSPQWKKFLPRSDESSRTTKRSPRAMGRAVEALRADQNGGAFEPASHAVAGRAFVSNATDVSVRAAFNALLASRFVQHSDVVVGLTRECCAQCSSLGLTTICRSLWNASSAPRSSGSRAANNTGPDRAPQSNLPYGICRGAVSCALGRACFLPACLPSLTCECSWPFRLA